MIPPVAHVPPSSAASSAAAPVAAERQALPAPRLDSATISAEALALLEAEASSGGT